jgi:SAM-dependent methyltransferase
MAPDELGGDRYYERLVTAYLAGRQRQGGDTVQVDSQTRTGGREPTRSSDSPVVSADGEEAPRYYFKRVSLLPRVQWALGVLRSVQPANLLDIGSGRGKFLWPLLDAFPELPVTAIDTNPDRVEVIDAVTRGGITRLTARQASATELPFADGTFDVVTLLEVLEHIPETQKALAEVVRVARRNVLLSVPSKPDANPEHIHLFDERGLPRLLADAGASQVKVQQVPGHLLVLAKVERAA